MQFDGYKYNKEFGRFCAEWAEGEPTQELESALEYLTFYLVRLHQGCVKTSVQLLPMSQRYIVRVSDYWKRELPDGTPCHFPHGEDVHHPVQVITLHMRPWMVQLITDHEDEFVPDFMLEH